MDTGDPGVSAPAGHAPITPTAGVRPATGTLNHAVLGRKKGSRHQPCGMLLTNCGYYPAVHARALELRAQRLRLARRCEWANLDTVDGAESTDGGLVDDRRTAAQIAGKPLLDLGSDVGRFLRGSDGGDLNLV